MPSRTDEILAKFAATYKKIDLSLGRLGVFLEEVGNPQEQIPPVIHIAGTNGKGSTLAFLRAILESAGKSVHAYNSPHLVKFNERITLNGEHIDDELLGELLVEIDEKTDAHPLTYFEKTTALAFLAFARKPADFLLLETGLGGLHDATNIVDEKLLTIITPISIDHVEYLGSDLLGIAAEKAGIMRNNSPCILGQQSEMVTKFFDDMQGYEITKSTPEKFANLGLHGDFQHINAATAKAAAQHLGISDEHILTGLKNAFWPARMQKIENGSLRDLLPKTCTLWLDGGHNAEGGAAIAANLQPKHMILGMLKSKDLAAFLNNFDASRTEIHTVPIQNMPESEAPKEVALQAKGLGFTASENESVEKALKKLQSVVDNEDILICGSLYLAGEFLQKNG